MKLSPLITLCWSVFHKELDVIIHCADLEGGQLDSWVGPIFRQENCFRNDMGEIFHQEVMQCLVPG